MKKRIIPLLLALGLLLSVSAAAVGSDEFLQGNFSGITAGPGGTLLVTDVFNKIVWQVSGDGTPASYAGAIPVEDLSGEPEGVYHDGPADTAFFMLPWAISPFLDGYAVSDADAHVVRYTDGTVVQTLVGSGTAGNRTGSDRTSAFEMPTGLATGDDGTLYVADTGSGVIRTISTTGQVSEYLTGLVSPTGLCWHNGALYIAETGLNRICKAENGRLEVIAGSGTPAEDPGEYYGGYTDGPVDKALFDHPQGVAVGSDGAIYVADTNNQAVRVIRDGRVETLAVCQDGVGLPYTPRTPLYLNGTLYVTDLYGGGIFSMDVGSRQVFRDVSENAWYHDAVYRAVDLGLTNGTGEDTFSPNDPVSRAMFVTMLGRMHRISDGAAVINGAATFPDVPDGTWYSGSARWAADLGVVKGVDGYFLPNAGITREQIATMFYRYAQSQGLDVSASGDLSGFRDAAAVSGWAQEAVRWACGAGLLQGSDGVLDPGGSATRAQVVTIFLRFMDLYGI